MTWDVITFGSATIDLFLGNGFSIEPVKKFISQKGICFPLGAKIDVRDLAFHSGGGGTNSAAGLSLLGYRTAFCGSVGKDWAGQLVLQDLKRFRVASHLVVSLPEKRTNLSLILSWARERTCLVWKEASEWLEEIPWSRIKAKWFYLAPLSGRLAGLFEPLVNFAKDKDIKLFVNPGSSQIRLGLKKLKPILAKIDVLLLNREEASLLTNIAYQKEKEIFRKLDLLMPGIAIMTQGERGAVVSDGRHLWRARSPRVTLVEKTGAGDAFGSGFLAGFLEKGVIEFGLRQGIANAASCIQKRGAKVGLLKKGQSLPRIRIIKEKTF